MLVPNMHYHYSAFNPFVSQRCRQFHNEFWRRSREATSQESEHLLRHGAGNGMFDFISWFQQKVFSNFDHWLSFTLHVDGTCG